MSPCPHALFSKQTLLEPHSPAEDILYEDDELLVINKAAGVVVHPAPGNWNGTLVSWTEEKTERSPVLRLVLGISHMS